jgi:uncharacterized RDD family membrane protein YckC
MDFNPNMNTPVQMQEQQSQFTRPTQTAPEIKPGGFWIRFLAVCIDNTIISILVLPTSLIFGIAVPLMSSSAGQSATSDPIGPSFFLSSAFNIIISIMYVGFFYSRKGATPGKMLFKLSVVNANDGTYLTFTQAAMRDTLGKFVSSIIFLIGFIMAAFDPNKRALHDRMFGTQVIRKIS